jgi:signal transduction histidine kinase
MHNPSTCRLLIVDDEPEQVTALCRTLEADGYSTTGVSSGPLALGALRAAVADSATAFDIILIDLVMPGTDGIMLLRAAKEIDCDLVGIVVTGHATMETAVEAMKNGAFDYIQKPIDLHSMIPVINRAFAMRRLRIDNTKLFERVVARTGELEEANRQLRIANEDLAAFNASVAHDLRQPLNCVIGYGELLSAEVPGPLNAMQKQYVGEIYSGGNELLRLTNDLLRFSRLGQQSLHKERVAVATLVQDIFDDLRDAAPGRNIELRMTALPDVLADPILLKQVLVNLLSNAIKFTGLVPNAVIEVEGRIQAGACTYSVRDNGAGFDMADAQRLFTMFHRLQSSGKFEGSGVGLALAQRIIERHGGRISAEAAVGNGATFSFSLPECDSALSVM